MKIVDITIFLTNGMDIINLNTDLPFASFPFEQTGERFMLKAAKNTGEDYVKLHFPGINYTVKDIT